MKRLQGTTRSLGLALSVLVATLAPAGERTHVVRGGESASTIAQQHYGDQELGSLLLRYNRKPGTMIRVGETLRVPYCEIHRVRRGDTWSKLAQSYLGNASVYPAVATLNGLLPEQALQVGARIVIPVVLSHRMQRGETLNRLAQRFYGDEAMRDVLRSFNGIEDPRRLAVGQSIAIPLVTLRLRQDLHADSAPEQPPAAPSSADASPVAPALREPAPPPAAATEEPVARFAEELRGASEAFSDGDYAAARELLESLLERVAAEGSEAEKAGFGRLLAFTYVAFDLPDEACTAYRSMGAAASPLDEDQVSPKIRETLAGCEGGDRIRNLRK